MSPPSPIEVKKLIANLVSRALSLGNNPEKTSCMYGSLNLSRSFARPDSQERKIWKGKKSTERMTEARVDREVGRQVKDMQECENVGT